MNINEYLDKAKEKLNLTSDYAFSKQEKIPRSTISSLRNKTRTADEYIVFRLAEILEMDARDIIIDLKAESEKNPSKREFWLSQLASRTAEGIKRGLRITSYNTYYVK